MAHGPRRHRHGSLTGNAAPGLLAGLLGALIIGDPGRIDRDLPWLRILTSSLIGVITLVNADAAIRLVISIIDVSPFTTNAKVLLASGGAIWLTNVIAFGLWYWDLDRGGPAARASGTGRPPALIFPEMKNEEHVAPDWSPQFVDCRTPGRGPGGEHPQVARGRTVGTAQATIRGIVVNRWRQAAAGGTAPCYRYQPICTDVANSAPWRLHSRRCSSEVDRAPRVPNASLRSSSSPT